MLSRISSLRRSLSWSAASSARRPLTSRAMTDAATTFPDRSCTGDTESDTSTSEPSLRRRTVSKCSTRRLAVISPRITPISLASSSGTMMAMLRPTASAAV